MRNALLVPTNADSAVTPMATMQLVQMLPSNSPSAKSPVRPLPKLPRKPIERKAAPGRCGVGRVVEGEYRDHRQGQKNRKARNAIRYAAVAVRSQTGRGREGITFASSRRRSAAR